MVYDNDMELKILLISMRVITLYGGFTVLVRMLMIKDKEIV
jgi:hypothetical protein